MRLKFKSQTKKIQKTLKPKAKMTQRRLVLKKHASHNQACQTRSPSSSKETNQKEQRSENQETQGEEDELWGEQFQANWAAAPPTPKGAEQEEDGADEAERAVESETTDADPEPEQKQTHREKQGARFIRAESGVVNTQYGPTTCASSQTPNVGTSANQGSSVIFITGRAGCPQPEIHTSDASSEPSPKKTKTDKKINRHLEADDRGAVCPKALRINQREAKPYRKKTRKDEENQSEVQSNKACASQALSLGGKAADGHSVIFNSTGSRGPTKTLSFYPLTL